MFFRLEADRMVNAVLRGWEAQRFTVLEQFFVLQRNDTGQFLEAVNGATGLAFEVGENKSKGGESPYAGTSLIDMQENIEGIEALYQMVFEDPLKEKDAKLAGEIHEKIEAVEKLVKVKSLKALNQPALHKGGEELAVLLQSAALKLDLNKPAVGEK